MHLSSIHNVHPPGKVFYHCCVHRPENKEKTRVMNLHVCAAALLNLQTDDSCCRPTSSLTPTPPKKKKKEFKSRSPASIQSQSHNASVMAWGATSLRGGSALLSNALPRCFLIVSMLSFVHRETLC